LLRHTAHRESLLKNSQYYKRVLLYNYFFVCLHIFNSSLIIGGVWLQSQIECR